MLIFVHARNVYWANIESNWYKSIFTRSEIHFRYLGQNKTNESSPLCEWWKYENKEIFLLLDLVRCELIQFKLMIWPFIQDLVRIFNLKFFELKWSKGLYSFHKVNRMPHENVYCSHRFSVLFIFPITKDTDFLPHSEPRYWIAQFDLFLRYNSTEKKMFN